MSREPIPSWFFVLVVVRLGHRFLLVQDAREGHAWYLPSGRCRPGESFVAAGKRIVSEMAGIPVKVEGLVRLEHTVFGGAARLRAVVVARPRDDQPPKTTADDHSLRAAWATRDEAKALPLRTEEVAEIVDAVSLGVPIWPLEILAREGEPFA